jgi:hypothetical protein
VYYNHSPRIAGHDFDNQNRGLALKLPEYRRTVA